MVGRYASNSVNFTPPRSSKFNVALEALPPPPCQNQIRRHWAEISDFVHVVVIGIGFHVHLEILKPYAHAFKQLLFLKKTFFRMPTVNHLRPV